MKDYSSADMTKRLEQSFTYHSPKDDQHERYVLLRDTAKAMALLIDKYVPNGREKSTAITRVEEAIMWANKGIAVGE